MRLNQRMSAGLEARPGSPMTAHDGGAVVSRSAPPPRSGSHPTLAKWLSRESLSCWMRPQRTMWTPASS